jgi:hypothetical protein
MSKPMNLLQFWRKYKWHILIILSILAFFFLLFFTEREKDTSNLFPNLDVKIPKKPKCLKKNENECRRILTNLFQKPFDSVRPDFLKYKTGKNLEIDLYNEELKMGLEYQGVQHYKYTPYFHKKYEDFLSQMERDKWKKAKLKELNIKLIEIPYTVKFEDLEKYIKECLNKEGVKI